MKRTLKRANLVTCEYQEDFLQYGRRGFKAAGDLACIPLFRLPPDLLARHLGRLGKWIIAPLGRARIPSWVRFHIESLEGFPAWRGFGSAEPFLEGPEEVIPLPGGWFLAFVISGRGHILFLISFPLRMIIQGESGGPAVGNAQPIQRPWG